MTIYIVTSGEYSDYGIRNVFLDRDKALAYCAAHESNYEPPEIEEWETADEAIQTAKKVFEKWFGLYVFGSGTLYMNGQCYTFDSHSIVKPTSSVRFGRAEAGLDLAAILPIGSTKEKAEKVMHDMVAKWKYEQAERGKNV